MNKATHTVTIPISDYEELVAAAADKNLQFHDLKTGLINRLKSMTTIPRHLDPYEFINAVVKEIEKFPKS